MRFGREVHDGIEFLLAQQSRDQRRVANGAMNEAEFWAMIGRFQIRHIAGIGQGIEHRLPIPRMLGEPAMDEVRPDESGPAGNEESRHVLPNSRVLYQTERRVSESGYVPASGARFRGSYISGLSTI
jgi:hypothetical protein